MLEVRDLASDLLDARAQIAALGAGRAGLRSSLAVLNCMTSDSTIPHTMRTVIRQALDGTAL